MTTTPDTRTRFQKRQWQRRLKVMRPFLISAAVVVLLAFGCWVVFFSTWLAADAVDVSGDKTVSRDQILEAAAVDLGSPLARIDLQEIQQRVEAVPAVASASVHRSWPHTVTIAITEREPVATVYRQGAWWALDAEGVVFRKSADHDPGLPVVAVPARLERDALGEVATVVAALPADLMEQVRRVTAQSMDSIELRLKGQSTVVWGSAAESDRKVEVLVVLLDQVKGASRYDVSVPDQPTTSR